MTSKEPEHPDLADFERLARLRFGEALEYEQEAAMICNGERPLPPLSGPRLSRS